MATGAGAAPDPATVRFRFAFGALTGGGAAQKLTSITQDSSLKTGDRIKLMVEIMQPCFVYLLHRGPNGEIDVLFPVDIKPGAQAAGKHYVPGGSGWLKLDNQAGDETFYLLGSAERLSGLEAMLGRYAAATAADKASLALEIVAEVRRLRAAHRNAVAVAEKPVIIGGNVRSLGNAPATAALPDVSTLAVEVTAGDYYAKTFTIAHQ